MDGILTRKALVRPWNYTFVIQCESKPIAMTNLRLLLSLKDECGFVVYTIRLASQPQLLILLQCIIENSFADIPGTLTAAFQASAVNLVSANDDHYKPTAGYSYDVRRFCVPGERLRPPLAEPAPRPGLSRGSSGIDTPILLDLTIYRSPARSN